MRMTAAMQAALRAINPVVVGLVEVNLPGYDLRLLDGASQVNWGGNRFVGRDPVYGSWISSDSFSDGMGDEAPAMSIQLAPSSEASAAELTAAEVQGSRARIWFAVIDKTTGGLVPDPLLLFEGVLDQPSLDVDKRKLTLDYDLVTAFEGLFLDDEGIRLSDAHHQAVWPGEKGLEYMTGTNRTIIWGPGDRPAGIAYTSRASSGGGMFFGRYLA